MFIQLLRVASHQRFPPWGSSLATAAASATSSTTQMIAAMQETERTASSSRSSSSPWCSRGIASSAFVAAGHRSSDRKSKKKASRYTRATNAAKDKAAVDDREARTQERRAARRHERQDLRQNLRHEGGASNLGGGSGRGPRSRAWARDVFGGGGGGGRGDSRRSDDDDDDDDDFFYNLGGDVNARIMRDLMGGGRGSRGGASQVKYKHRPGGNPQKTRGSHRPWGGGGGGGRGWDDRAGDRDDAFAFQREIEKLFYQQLNEQMFGRNTGGAGSRSESRGGSDPREQRDPPDDGEPKSKNQARRDRKQRRAQEAEGGDDWMRWEEYIFSGQGAPQFHQHRQQRQQQQEQPSSHGPFQHGGGGSRSHPACPDCKVLGIAPGVALSGKMLKESLRVQAMKWHPDRHQSAKDKAEAETKFKRVYTAYDTLVAKL